MISKENMRYITKAIKIYDKLVNRDYLIAYSINMNQPLCFIEVQISERNFWHLVGCKIDEKKNLAGEERHTLYIKCLQGNDISKYLNYTGKPSDVKVKSEVVQKIFNFIDNAKIIRLTDTEGTPEQFMFNIGSGTANGLIGYMKKKHIYIPKTSQNKSIYMIDKNANKKIVIVLSKQSIHKQYDTIEYEASKNLFVKLSSEFLKNYKLAGNLKNII